MRCAGLLIPLVMAGSVARAEVRIGAAVGAGGQGPATYAGLDLRLDAAWSAAHGRLGLGARGIWLDGAFRRADWDGAADAIRVVRLLELAGEVGEAKLAVAAGGLAPAQLGHVADGYRATLDDRPRTGVRGSLATEALGVTLELDDVVEPGLAGGALSWQITPRWVALATTAIDPQVREGAIELAGARRWSGEQARVDVGGGVVGEPGQGAAALGFAETAIDRAGARWTAGAELRAGTGTVGAAFGPLHRIERATLYAQPRSGVGAAAFAGVAGRAGWVHAELRARPGLGGLATASAGAPMGRWIQAGAWIAASRHDAAGAGELRVAWAKRLASALEVARMYASEPGEQAMTAAPAWSVTAWFAATTE